MTIPITKGAADVRFVATTGAELMPPTTLVDAAQLPSSVSIVPAAGGGFAATWIVANGTPQPRTGRAT